MNTNSWLAILTIGLLTCCSSQPTPTTEQSAVSTGSRSEKSGGAEKFLAQAGGPCFFKGTMYSDGAASCQSGIQYRCTNGEWLNIGAICREDAVAVSRPCQYSGVTFPTGTSSCQSGMQYRCEDGTWRSSGASCPSGDSPIQVVPGGRTCMLEGGSTVATSSSVCRSGTTYLCNDGEWVNLGTQCR